MNEQRIVRGGIVIGMIFGSMLTWIIGDLGRAAGDALAIWSQKPSVYQMTAADREDLANRIATRMIEEMKQ